MSQSQSQCRTERSGQADWLPSLLSLLSLSPPVCTTLHLQPGWSAGRTETNGNQATGRKKTTGWLLSVGGRWEPESYYNLTFAAQGLTRADQAGPTDCSRQHNHLAGKSADQCPVSSLLTADYALLYSLKN